MVEQQASMEKHPFGGTTFGPLSIIAMPGCEELGARVDMYLKKFQREEEQRFQSSPGGENGSFLIKTTFFRFPTGEGKAMLEQTVRGQDVYIISDVTAYQVTYTLRGQEVPTSPDEHYADLKRVISAIGGRARRICVIMPFLYEGRQHRRVRRESLDCALMLHELVSMGVQNIITFDAHDPRVQNSIPLTGFDSVYPTYQMLKALLRHEKDLHISKDSMVVISPDEGAISRNMYYSSVLGLDMGLFYKRRDYTKFENGRNPIIAHEYLGDDIEGKDVIVADDMISSGDSMIDLAESLAKRKAGRIFIAATFTFFTDGLEKFNKAYEEGLITRVLGTNLVYLPPEIKNAPWFIEVDMSKYVSYIISTLNHDNSLNSALDPLLRIETLLQKYRAEQQQQ